ncbi:oxaloacetate decarboxylase subunit gamma [Psychromonas sp. RZ22]|uniref:oxaloacetate decarboxylase subunit gamma n=1 Tax=Psychromonas algarum TaxID=2555643 RepID=UPI001067E41E|nr:oxaloacetate decarboxylase subunit gamma [Psychromonas sp. RZ22]TEW55650.1 oxaloacetate decarboxylase subunit gamma [Psychromonas sp. RZ22]
MDITESLVTALTLLGLGMAFVYVFLGLLFVFISLMAKYVPADQPSTPKQKKSVTPKSEPQAQMSPQVIAAITSAVKQYRKQPVA